MDLKLDRIERILKELSTYRYSNAQQITDFKLKEVQTKDLAEVEAAELPWEDFEFGRQVEERTHYWIRTEVEIPESFQGQTAVVELDKGLPEAVAYVNKEPVRGVDRHHRYITLAKEAVPGTKYTIDLHCFNGTKQANADINGIDTTQEGSFVSNSGEINLSGKLEVLNPEVEKLYYDIKVPLRVAKLHEEGDKTRLDILNYLTEAINILDLRKPFSQQFFASVNESIQYLAEEFYGDYCGDKDLVAHCVGHTHIDVAWLWTLEQTREKVARSFSTVLRLMEEYPEYLFMSSQPKLYQFLKEDYPQIYEQVKEKIAEGRWEAEGAMWLEADCNLTSGESLIRQIMFGTRFFKEEFGVENKILWLPDVFGYSAALPQILKGFGIEYFMTTKINWNEYNQLPYDTFTWEGLDGSQVLTHCITTSEYDSDGFFTKYNGFIGPSQIKGSWQRYQQKDINDEVLVSYGFGDGGGGPTKAMLEQANRLNEGIPGCPQVELGTARDYFEKLDHKVADNDKLPKWVGELYLEYHRGTYTTMAKNKKYNRKSEFLYQDVELFNVLQQCITDTSNYPQQEINDGWETILLNQFHDIIPGTSIKPVYEDSHQQYEEAIDQGESLLTTAFDKITDNINLGETSIVVFNQLDFKRDDIVECELPAGYENIEIRDNQGQVMDSQIIEDKTGKQKLLFFAEGVPPKGYKTFTIQEGSGNDEEAALEVGKRELSNQFFKIKFDEQANIKSIYDKINQREVLKEGTKANQLQAFEDKALLWDAWDIHEFYREKKWEVDDLQSIEIVETGPVRATLKITREFMESTIEQYIQIYHRLPRIDVKNRIDWKEKQVLLKAAFPVDIHSKEATYEIQYGNLTRPTHENTSWDRAKFEVVGHKWADLSEDNYGVSLLNDCKYGHDIKDGVMRLTLIKSPIRPNEEADRGIHEFTYSLYPHGGDWKAGGTVPMAYQLNCPLHSKVEPAHDGNLPTEYSIISLDQENVVLEVIKQAEDSKDIIIRLYECYNRRSEVNITCAHDLEAVWECNLNEKNKEELAVDDNQFSFVIKPYEIKTFKLRFGEEEGQNV